MAGGKETPRQKMIGMMYLVLTALLALNVSKAILDAFISIEENIQKANETEYYRGDAKRKELLSVARSEENAEKAERAKKMLQIIDEIDKVTADRIQEIDKLKIDILKACGEEVSTTGKDHIVMTKFNPNQPIVPLKLDLNKVKGQDKYDESMRIMIGEDIKNPKGDGLKMWENFNSFKLKICQYITNYTSIDGSKSYKYQAPDIRKFINQDELNSQLIRSFAKQEVNNEDKETVLKIYSILAKNERSTVHEVKNVHWLGKTFDHSPVVASIASLSSLQKEILSARADAISLLFGRVGGGEYTFNKIIALAYGPELVANGEKINIEVLMAAYDSDINPKVTMNGNQVETIENGKGQISMLANGTGEMLVQGTISITNKHGLVKQLPWQKKITVMQPMGAISIPAFNVLYVGYDNVLKATVSGYDQTELKGQNVDLVKRGDQWIAHPLKGQRNCKITIYGKSSVTGTLVNLGTVDYRVNRMPPPLLFLGGTGDGGKIPPGTKNLIVKYPTESPLQAPFDIIEWQMTILNVPVPPPSGAGSELSAKAMDLISQAPRGQAIEISVKVRDQANQVSFIRSTFKK